MDLILHHYDISSYSEKIRLVLGLKGLSWRAVEIPAYPPKPDYEPLTAGNRRTPALQIGADVYCDTQLIADVLERLAPAPSLYPGIVTGAFRAQVLALSAWAESSLARPIALYITGLHAAQFSPDFHRDRARLHGKPEPTLAQVEASASRYQAQVEGQLARIEALLGAGHTYLLGNQPSLADIAVYCGPWFLEVIGGSSPLIARHRLIRPWMAHVAEIGHGVSIPLSPAAALDCARAAEPIELSAGVNVIPEGITLGDDATVTPFEEYSPATGRLVYVDDSVITIATEGRQTGLVHVHFPRLGYRLTRTPQHEAQAQRA